LGGLALIGTSYQAYGLRAQTALQFAQLLPLLLAGLLLGRTAMGATALASAAALVFGARVDMGIAGNPVARSEVMPALLLAEMNLFILVAVLDRLILSTRRAIKRSEELDATCLALEREVAEKEQAYARLLQTQRMEAIGRLSTGIAHDFHNILSIIFGLATSPLSPSDSPAPILAKIRKAAGHGTALTRRLLSFGRTQSSELVTFDLVEAIEEMMPLIKPMFFGDINVALQLPAPGILVQMDQEELELVLLNIASNARDAMPNGGQFTLRVEREPDHARIELEDTGIGMTPDVLAKVFEPFFTTKPKDKGTGIGMAVVHRFVEDCGGNISIKSAPGAGTCIAIRIPVVSTTGFA
jgi:signal transduction histidine kinase